MATTSIKISDMSTTTFATSGFEEAAVSNEKFTLFRELAAELRLAIWEFALPGPRILYINQYATHYEQRSYLPEFPAVYPSNYLSGLGMLHTCREARDVALKTFNILPSARDSGPLGLGLARELYFRPESDMLYFVAPDTLMYCAHHRDSCPPNYAEDRLVRKIAVPVRYTQGTLKITPAFIFFGTWPNFQVSE